MKERNERRLAPRRQTLEEHGIVLARVRPGRDVALVDVSAGGALVESAHRLLPGSLVELYLASVGRCASIRGRVLRCAVARLKATGVWYHGAIGFDRDLSWFSDHGGVGYGVPTTETRGPLPDRGVATRDT